MTAGQWYRCGFQASSQSDIDGVMLSGQVLLDFGSGIPQSVYFMGSQGIDTQNGVPIGAGEALIFQSQPFFVPSVPSAGGYLLINVLLVKPIERGLLHIGRAFCRSVDDPYR
jgi:hypothetical protein